MKLSQVLFLCLFLNYCTHAQVWTWMHGTDTVNTFGVDGPFTAANRPPSLTTIQSWTDLSGNFWMYGGQHKLGNVIHSSSEMWKYTVSSNQWTKISGSSTLTTGNYGTMNVPAASNSPGSRLAGASWTDSNNNFWMFGGFGVGTGTVLNTINDLWRYNPATNQWTWMNGPALLNQYGVYGTMGVGSSSTVPGARFNAQAWIVNDTLYLYGGIGYAASTWGTLSDLWRYVISTGQWTWIKGSNVSYQNANFGTINFPSPTNSPGGRSSSCTWVDNNRTLWLFGGNTLVPGFGTCTTGDLWRYNINTNIWTWQKGSNQPYPSVQYGTLGVPSATAEPGTRAGAAMWTDNNGDLWLFGSSCVINSTNLGLNSDLWRYSRSSNQWTWMHGPNMLNVPGSYGTRFLPQLSNLPPRRSGASSFKDAAGNLWLYGGDDNTAVHYTDLWRLSSCTVAPGSPSGLSASASSVCAGAAIQFSVSANPGNVFWQTSPGTGAVQTGSSISVIKAPGNYTITPFTANMCTVSAGNPALTFTVYAAPIVSSNGGTVCSGNVFTLSAGGASTYSWSTGSNTIQPLSNTTYTVTGFGPTGCISQNSVVATVSVFAKPVISVSSGSICAGAFYTLTPSGAATYTYLNGSQTISAIVSPPVPGDTYTIVGATPEGCFSSTTVAVTTYSLPIVVAGGGTICAGDQFTIVPSGAQNYTLSSGAAIVSPPQTQTYSVLGENLNGCRTAAATILTVTVNQKPQLNFLSRDSIACSGETRSYTVSGAQNYTWQDNSTGPVLTVLFSFTSKTITAVGTGSNSCSNNLSLVLLSDACTGVSELMNKILVFPNPFDRMVSISTDLTADLTIADLYGSCLFSAKVDPGQSTVDLSALPRGVYILSAASAARVQYLRLVRQ